MKEENIKRFKNWMTNNDVKQKDISDVLGVQDSYVSNILGGKVNVGAKTAGKLKDAYGFNPKWLINDEEPMFISEMNKEELNNHKIEVEKSIDRAPLIKPVIPEEIIMQQGVDIFEWMNNNKDRVEMLMLSHLLPPFDIVYRVISDGMKPQVEKGDILALRCIPDKRKIIDGECYMIDTSSQGFLIRRLHYKKGKFTCESNIPEYGVMEIDEADVFNIFAIVGLVRNRVTSHSEMAHLFEQNRKKDEHIDKMLTIMEKMTDNMSNKQ